MVSSAVVVVGDVAVVVGSVLVGTVGLGGFITLFVSSVEVVVITVVDEGSSVDVVITVVDCVVVESIDGSSVVMSDDCVDVELEVVDCDWVDVECVDDISVADVV